jgi:U3 small nucleolar RNA-associated protein 21
LLSFGKYLISVADDHMMAVWDITNPGEPPAVPVSEIPLPADDSVQCIMHPDAYLNKVVVGFESGAVEIYNIRSCHRVYRLKQW